jgi:F420-dependent oxidoreductase-like protein
MRFGHMLLTHSKGHDNYFDTVTTLARATESLPIESLWFPDHFMFANPNRPDQQFEIMECFTSMAAVAAITERVKLGAYVAGVPYRNPAMLAKMLTTIDLISHGRSIIGLGAAWHELEFKAYGWPFEPARVRLDRLEEAIKVVVAMMTQRPANFAGQYYQVVDAFNDPWPVQRPHPPIMIGGGGEQRTLRLVAQYADYYNIFRATPDQVRHKYAILQEHCRAVGRAYEAIVRTSHVTVLIGKDRAEADAKRERHRRFLAEPLIGTPDEVIAGLRAYRAAGSQYVIFNLQDGHLIEPLHLMGEKVIPALLNEA